MERKAREDATLQKKRTIAFSDNDDEDLSLLVKNVRRMYNKAKFNNRR